MGERLAKWLVVQLGKNDSGGTKSLETRCVESLLVVYVCVSLLSLLGAKREFLQQGPNGQSAPPQNCCDYNAAEAAIQADLPGNSPSNALSLELLALMIVHVRSLSLCADVPAELRYCPQSLFAIILHEGATNNQSQSTCPRHL